MSFFICLVVGDELLKLRLVVLWTLLEYLGKDLLYFLMESCEFDLADGLFGLGRSLRLLFLFDGGCGLFL
jgi:hypothetical protein